MESPGNGLPLTGFPFNQAYSFSCPPATGACNTIYKLPDGQDMAHPDRLTLFMNYNRWQKVVLLDYQRRVNYHNALFSGQYIELDYSNPKNDNDKGNKVHISNWRRSQFPFLILKTGI